MLSRYFETARTLIERYGGTVEKFIGDAVMAVWGTPVAQEDDAERAVRTALDLVAAVPELDPGATGAGRRADRRGRGDARRRGPGHGRGRPRQHGLRIQSAAEPGAVLVGEATKRATEAAVAYEDAGEHELKGKAEGLTLWRALRVTAARGGAQRTAGLEPPFVGRDRELRLVKELFHATEEERRAQLLSVVGAAGIGKSRLGWEFEKYVDGLVELVYWHRGRCLSYGEGVAYWALGGDGADAGRDRRGRVTRVGARRSSTRRSTRTSPIRTSAGSSSRGWRTCSASRRVGPGARMSSSAPGVCSSSASPRIGRWCCCSRISSGPMPRWSSSSRTCSSGRAAIRSSSSASPDRSWSSATRSSDTAAGRRRCR